MGSCLSSCVAATTESATNSATNSATASTSSSSASSTACVTAVANSWLLWRRPRSKASRGATSAADETEAELLAATGERCQRRSLVYRILKFKRKKQCPQFLDRYWEQPPSYAKLPNDRTGLADIQLQNLDAHKLLNAITTPSRETDLQNNYTRLTSSRASSSLDLEWEHEYSQLQKYQQRQHKEEHEQLQSQPRETPTRAASQPRYASLDQLTTTASLAANHGRLAALRQARLGGQRYGGSFTRTSCCSSTQNSWSHISTPESLEWDIDAEQEQQQQLRQEDDNLDEETLKLLHQIEQLKHHVLQETGDGLSIGVGVGVSVAVEEFSDDLQFRSSHFGVAKSSELEVHTSS